MLLTQGNLMKTVGEPSISEQFMLRVRNRGVVAAVHYRNRGIPTGPLKGDVLRFIGLSIPEESMSSCFNRFGRRAGRSTRRDRSFGILSGCCALIVALFAYVLVGSFALAVHAGQARTVKEGVYTNDQATRGQAIYKDKCSSCHLETLQGDVGPPLTGTDFIAH